MALKAADIEELEDQFADCAEKGDHSASLKGVDAWGRVQDMEELKNRLAATGRPHMQLRRISPEVISCSRRTDVPAHYTSGLVKILERGEVLVVVRDYYHLVSLSPDTVKAWVWWSKNYAPWIEAFKAHTELFTRYRAHLFHFTITGLDELESVSASLEERLDQITFLSKIGRVVVRFDPLVRYRTSDDGVTRSNAGLARDLIPRFKAAGASEVTFKFCVTTAGMRGTRGRMQARGFPYLEWPAERKRVIVRELMAICAEVNIPLRACCPLPEERVEGLQISACVDGDSINQILGEKCEGVSLKKDRGQRTACRCVEAKDIGSYEMKCPHECVYCYAQPGAVNQDFL